MDSVIPSLLEIADTLNTIKITRGRILAITSEGEIMVEREGDLSCITCDFLRTSSAPLPELNQGDLVLYAVDESIDRGYVLGIIQKYTSEEDPRYLKINAKESIELRCGNSTMIMNKEGKVIVKGNEVVSRARGINKIKGAAVKIN
jgi:hypothetical protein